MSSFENPVSRRDDEDSKESVVQSGEIVKRVKEYHTLLSELRAEAVNLHKEAKKEKLLDTSVITGDLAELVNVYLGQEIKWCNKNEDELSDELPSEEELDERVKEIDKIRQNFSMIKQEYEKLVGDSF
jgi:uncharacterized coiled-coil DUF342 family protein